jgi:hypothetical protein
VVPLTVSPYVTIDLGSTATKSISLSLSGDDLDGGGACDSMKIKNKYIYIDYNPRNEFS